MLNKEVNSCMGRPMQLVSMYALQQMLITWMQHIGQMAKIDLTSLQTETTIASFS